MLKIIVNRQKLKKRIGVIMKILQHIIFNIHAVLTHNKLKKFKGTKKYLNFIFGIIDILSILFALFTAYFIRNSFFHSKIFFNNEYLVLVLFLISIWFLLLKTTTLAAIPRTSRYLTLFFNYARVNLIGFILMMFFILVFQLDTISLRFVLIFSVVNLISLYSIRLITYKLFKYYRANGHNLNNVIIVADAFSDTFIEKILDQKEWGFRVLMILSDSKLIKAKFGNKIKVIPERANIKSLIDNDIVDEVIYSKNRLNHSKIQEIIQVCEEIGVVFRLQSDLSPMSSSNAYMVDFEGTTFLTFMNTPKNSIALGWKSVTDILLSAAMLLVLSPVLLLISILIKLDSKGPVIFKQARVGLRGRKFYIYKFRTMVQDAEKIKEKLMQQNEMDGPVFKIKRDPRITRLGRILRKTGLDEFPQLYNVVKGEMSLIGPRPPLPDEVKQYERWHLRRLSIKPGITCTWQIIPNRNEVLFENWMKLDLNYIDNWSLRLDFKLLMKTIRTVILGSGA